MRAGVHCVATFVGAGLAVLAFTVSARADNLAHRRATCEPVMTVVREGCEAANHYQCPDGAWFSDTLMADGGRAVELSDAEGGLIYGVDPATGEGWRRVLSTDRAFSLPELLRDGASSGSYMAEIQIMFPFPRPGRITIDAQLTDEMREIDGVAFRVADATMAMEVGTGGMMATATVPILIDTAHGFLVTDGGTTSFNGVTMEVGDKVERVILPGQPGFMPAEPGAVCQDILSSLALVDPSHG